MTLCIAPVIPVQIPESIVVCPVGMKLHRIREIHSLPKTIISMHRAQGQFVGSLLFGLSKKIDF